MQKYKGENFVSIKDMISLYDIPSSFLYEKIKGIQPNGMSVVFIEGRKGKRAIHLNVDEVQVLLNSYKKTTVPKDRTIVLFENLIKSLKGELETPTNLIDNNRDYEMRKLEEELRRSVSRQVDMYSDNVRLRQQLENLTQKYNKIRRRGLLARIINKG